MKEKAEQISMTNTKKEMLEAYNKLLTEMEDKRKTDMKPTEKAKIIEQETTVKKADSLSSEKVINDISSLKYEFGSVLTNLSDKLEEEISKYQAVKKAVEMKEKELNEIYEIQKEASSLAALIETQKVKTAEFEDEMESQRDELDDEIFEKKSNWDKERKLHDAEVKERNEKIQKQREREKEEFEYNFNLKKKQFQDDFDARKTALERELENLKEETDKKLSEREKAVSESEHELEEMRKKVAAHEEEMKKAIENAVKQATESIILESQHNESMLKAQFEGEKQALNIKIESFERIIQEQAQRIEKLSAQIDKSYGQVQDIALKAVEGSAAKTSQQRNQLMNINNQED